MSTLDAVRIEVMRNLFASIPEEMGIALRKSSFSPNIKERRDYSCALFDGSCAMIAQAAHIPVHLGSTPLSVRAALAIRPALEPGDMVLLNDPYRGGTHLPDLTLVAPVFLPRITKRPRRGKTSGAAPPQPDLFVANRAHHADVGGIAPGSMALTTEIFQEGVRIPPVKIVKRGRLDEDLLRLFLANVRTPVERRGDLEAQIAANRIGIRRVEALLDRIGRDAVFEAADALQDYSERLLRRTIKTWPKGAFTAEDAMDDDGVTSEPIPLRVTLRIQSSGSIEVDFTGSAPEVRGCLNANEAITLSAVLYCVRCAAAREIPMNDGCFRPIRIIAPHGSVVNARFPSSVAGGNCETSQRIVDVTYRALAQALPAVMPADSAGTMNNLTFGGRDPRNAGAPFSYYETIAGGMGARPGLDGLSAVQTHMTNTLNTPVEAFENAYPVRIRRYAIRNGSGGRGASRGGDGLVRSLEALCPMTLTILSERRTFAPHGLFGGEDGRPGRNTLQRAADGHRPRRVPGKIEIRMQPGDIFTVETPGGGGHGTPARATSGGDTIEVVLAVIERDEDGAVLVARRAPDVHLGALWEFPGGKREPGETEQMALNREVREETGLELVRLARLREIEHAYPDRRVRLCVYRCGVRAGRRAARRSGRLARWRWVDRAELGGNRYPMPEANRAILEALASTGASPRGSRPPRRS